VCAERRGVSDRLERTPEVDDLPGTAGLGVRSSSRTGTLQAVLCREVALQPLLGLRRFQTAAFLVLHVCEEVSQVSAALCSDQSTHDSTVIAFLNNEFSGVSSEKFRRRRA